MKRTKKILKLFFIFACLLIIFSTIYSGTAFAKQLYVKKVVQNTDIKTGDSVTISLEFANPFNQSLPVIIQDNNILGSNGLEIQCYEYTLPDRPHMTVPYDLPIQAFSAGDFTLGPATVTYRNPDTGNQESVKSDPLKISIKQGASTGQQQGVTSIYNCNGMRMQSTSYSSGGSTSISINSGNINQQISQINRQIQQSNQPPSPDNIQQQNQDMQNIKQEMERQQQDYRNMQNELRKKIENNSDFRQMKSELQKQGYTQQDSDIRPASNDSGEFEYHFRKDGENASISGKMNAGRMESINRQSTEDIKRIQHYIESNETFRQMQERLSGKGYNLSDKRIDLKPNISSFEYRFNDSQGRNASITGNVTTNAGEIRDISLNEPQESLPYWMLAFLILPLLGIIVYMKYRNNSRGPAAELSPPKVQVDPKEEALAKLENAVRMFNNGMQKEAYVEASIAVRTYFKGILGINELTSEEILRAIRKSKDESYIEDVKICFMLCDLVKFAKYEPDTADFNRVVEHAKRIIV